MRYGLWEAPCYRECPPLRFRVTPRSKETKMISPVMVSGVVLVTSLSSSWLQRLIEASYTRLRVSRLFNEDRMPCDVGNCSVSKNLPSCPASFAACAAAEISPSLSPASSSLVSTITASALVSASNKLSKTSRRQNSTRHDYLSASMTAAYENSWNCVV